MAEEKGTLQVMRGWVVDHKLRAVGAPRGVPLPLPELLVSFFTSFLAMDALTHGIAGSIAYNWSRPDMKTSVKLIHARSISSV
uniref:Uncharacterized protein n=1 Tax=Triticum aestivum TaxID=4565 RepID=A0A077RT13_WHEAT|nr:unnamed protein product [Triticum aestivum]